MNRAVMTENIGKPLASLVAGMAMKASHAGEKGGVILAVFGGLTATELAAFGGLAVAVLSYLTNAAMNWYFKWQHLKLARKLAKANEEE